MPDRRTHELIDILILGRKFSHVHKLKDLPSKYLGPNHRRLFHDATTNILIGALEGSEAMISAFLHDMVDEASTNIKLKANKKKRRRRKWKRR